MPAAGQEGERRDQEHVEPVEPQGRHDKAITGQQPVEKQYELPPPEDGDNDPC